jgi:hypothetical protein
MALQARAPAVPGDTPLAPVSKHAEASRYCRARGVAAGAGAGHSIQAAITATDTTTPAAAGTTAFGKPCLNISTSLFLGSHAHLGVPALGALHLVLRLKARNSLRKER